MKDGGAREECYVLTIPTVTHHLGYRGRVVFSFVFVSHYPNLIGNKLN